MKEIKFFLFAILAMAVVGCTSGDEPTPEPTPEPEPTSYTVKLSLGGEYVTIGEEPMGRADEPKKYYGINVYCQKTDGTESSYSKYAYGVFDNTSDMVISLFTGYKYKFECTSVKEEENIVMVYENKLQSPFHIMGQSQKTYEYYISNINKFKISQFEYLYELGAGFVTTHENGGYRYPSVDRFYGELEGFEPSNNGVATIPMKRTAFGIKMIINGVPDGKLEWSAYGYTTGGGIYQPQSSYDGTTKLEYENIYSFDKVRNCWCWNSNEPYTEVIRYSFTWTRTNGYKQKFETMVNAKPNVMSIVNVNLTGGASNITIGVNEDDTPMGSETINVDYDGGTGEDTPVNPQE